MDPSVRKNPKRSVSGSKLCSDPPSDPELSSSLGFFCTGLKGFNMLKLKMGRKTYERLMALEVTVYS